MLLRLAFLAGFLALSQCEEERTIRIKFGDNEVYRNAYYVEGGAAKLSCVPPKESNGKYDELALYFGNVTKESKPVCKASSTGQKCALNPADPSLTYEINQSGLYTCQYDKAPEPPVKPATVTVYFKNNNIGVFDEHDQPIRDVASLQVTNETTYRLVCPGAQPESKVHWYRNEHELKFDHGNANYELNDTTQILTFKKIKTPDASRFGGYYRCERVSKDGAPLGTSFVKVNSHAFVNAAQKSYNKMEGESATLSCEVDGEPVPKVTWKRGEKLLSNEGDDGKRFTFSSYKGISGASVTISNLVAEDYGEYVCVANGRDGSYAEAPTLLRVRSKLAALWPFLGIVAEVIILVVIIFIYEKRRARKEREENEDTADQKKSLTASNNENKDIRQRKA